MPYELVCKLIKDSVDCGALITSMQGKTAFRMGCFIDPVERNGLRLASGESLVVTGRHPGMQGLAGLRTYFLMF